MYLVVSLCSAHTRPGAFLGGKRGGGGGQPFFKNLKVRERDKLHGARRLLSRCWAADEFLNRIAELLVTGPSAITQRIRHSPIFKARFAKHVRELVGDPNCRISGFAAAKHRAESFSTPFARASLYMLALIRTAQSILDERGPRSAEGRDAAAWLDSLDVEIIVSIGCMADYADECMMIVRLLDSTDYDKSTLSSELTRFLIKATWLFDDTRGALTTGYTQHVIEMLNVPRVIFLPGGRKVLGGPGEPSAGTLTSCFRRQT